MDLVSNNIFHELESVVKVVLGYHEDQENLPEYVSKLNFFQTAVRLKIYKHS